MVGHQLKKIAQARGRASRSSVCDLCACPKHWSIYTLLFSTVFLLLFCFLLFDIKTSPTSLLLHASKEINILRAQATEGSILSLSRSTPVEREEDLDDSDRRDDHVRARTSDSVKESSEDFTLDNEQDEESQQEKTRNQLKDELSVEESLQVDTRGSESGRDVHEDLNDAEPSTIAQNDLVPGDEDSDEKSVKIDRSTTEAVPIKEDSDLANSRKKDVSFSKGVSEKEESEREDLEEGRLSSTEEIAKTEDLEEDSPTKSERSIEEAPETEERFVREVSSSHGSDEIHAEKDGLPNGEETSKVDVEVLPAEETSKKGSDTEKHRTGIVSKLTPVKKYRPSHSAPSNPPLLKSVTSDVPCDYSVGKWVKDESYPLYKPAACPFVDGGFRCVENGRPNSEFQKWRWQPSACDLPRFHAKKMLERLRGTRMAFVGDSIGRNNWESMLCMLAEGVANKSRIYEINGESIDKHKGFLAFKFEEYNCTVEYYRSPYLVPQGRGPPNSAPEVRSTLKLDVIDWSASKWKDAEIIIFNSGHWWSNDKTIRGGNYFQTKDKVRMKMEVGEAFKTAVETVAKWVDANVNPEKSQVFFRSYAPVHFRSGTWKTGGTCMDETQPMLLNLSSYGEPWSNTMIGEIVRYNKKTPIHFLNITLLSQYRSDGHSAIWQRVPPSPKNHQDCSHWCLPGVPDTWNEVLYATLLSVGQGPWSRDPSE